MLSAVPMHRTIYRYFPFSPIALKHRERQRIEKLLTCPEFLFAWQRNWPEYANAPELILTVKVGREETVHELVMRGEDPNIRHADGTTPPALAAATGREGILRYLLSAGA